MSDRIRRDQQSWCPYCKAEAGPDCPDTSVPRRAAVKRERQRVKKEITESVIHC